MSVKAFESDKWAVRKFFSKKENSKGHFPIFFWSCHLCVMSGAMAATCHWQQEECQPKIINQHSKNSRRTEWKYSKNLIDYRRLIAKLSESANPSIASFPEFLSEITHVILVLSYFLFSFQSHAAKMIQPNTK